MTDFKSVLQSSWRSTVGASALLGVLFHIAIRPYEIDSKAWSLVGWHMGVSIALVVSYMEVGNHDLLRALLRVWAVTTAFNAGLAGSILVYRAFLHRLHRFPGPFAAKLSRLYAAWNAAMRMTSHVDIETLHKQYGDFVRVGPRELSINRPSAIRAIYEQPTRCTKSPFYSQVSDDVTKISIVSTRDVMLHKQRKRAWDRGLSFRALSTYEPRLRAKSELLLSRIEAQEGRPIDMTKYAVMFGFDVMGEVGFSKDFGMLVSGDEHPAIRGLHDNMAAVGILGTVPWLLSMLGKVPGATGNYERFTNWCGQELKAKRKALELEKQFSKGDEPPKDVMSWLLKAEDENDKSAPPGEGAFQEDSRVMIIAGSDTTAVALTNALFYLVTHPACFRKLQHLVDNAFPGGCAQWTYEKAKTIDYLDHVIQETLRLKPSIPTGLARLTPAEGLQIDEILVPGDTIVSVPTYTIQRDVRYWDKALEFIPERWEMLSVEKVPWIPFTRGQYVCVGKNLALMELRFVLSRIALQFDMSLAPGTDPVQFEKNTKETFTLSLPPLPLVFTPREQLSSEPYNQV